MLVCLCPASPYTNLTTSQDAHRTLDASLGIRERIASTPRSRSLVTFLSTLIRPALHDLPVRRLERAHAVSPGTSIDPVGLSSRQAAVVNRSSISTLITLLLDVAAMCPRMCGSSNSPCRAISPSLCTWLWSSLVLGRRADRGGRGAWVAIVQSGDGRTCLDVRPPPGRPGSLGGWPRCRHRTVGRAPP